MSQKKIPTSGTLSAPRTVSLFMMLATVTSEIVSSRSGWTKGRQLASIWRRAGRSRGSCDGRSRIRTWDLFLIREAL